MPDDKSYFRTSRRRFVAGSAALAALGLVPGSLLAQSAFHSDRPAPATWLATLKDVTDKESRVVPYGFEAEPVHPDQMLRVRLRGPWSLAPGESVPAFGLGAVYRACPEPFCLPATSAECHQLLHVSATALAGLRVDCDGLSSDCALASPAAPALLPGRHVVLIDPTGRQPGPHWSALRWDSEHGQVASTRRQRLAALLVHVELA